MAIIYHLYKKTGQQYIVEKEKWTFVLYLIKIWSLEQLRNENRDDKNIDFCMYGNRSWYTGASSRKLAGAGNGAAEV